MSTKCEQCKEFESLLRQMDDTVRKMKILTREKPLDVVGLEMSLHALWTEYEYRSGQFNCSTETE